MKKHVLTGGPSIGKTTVIEILASRGYKIVPEMARIIIEEKIKEEARSGSSDKKFDRFQFQSEVADLQLQYENKIPDVEGVIFLDRGIVDGVGYLTIENLPIPELITNYGKNRYEKVFILDPLGVYVKDGVRGRTLEDANKLHKLVNQAYLDFGYKPIRVPVLSPEERADFIIDQINK